MKNLHTKGEWKLMPEPNNNVIGVLDENNKINPVAYIVLKTASYQLEVEANAKLIAAAPDMLEALKALMAEYKNTVDYLQSVKGWNAVDWDSTEISQWKQATTAIKKATE